MGVVGGPKHVSLTRGRHSVVCHVVVYSFTETNSFGVSTSVGRPSEETLEGPTAPHYHRLLVCLTQEDAHGVLTPTASARPFLIEVFVDLVEIHGTPLLDGLVSKPFEQISSPVVVVEPQRRPLVDGSVGVESCCGGYQAQCHQE